MKNILTNLLRIGVSVGLLWFLSTKIDIPKTIEVLKSADLKYLLYAFVVYCVIYSVLILRWCKFIRGLKLELKMKSVAQKLLLMVQAAKAPASAGTGSSTATPATVRR